MFLDSSSLTKTLRLGTSLFFRTSGQPRNEDLMSCPPPPRHFINHFISLSAGCERRVDRGLSRRGNSLTFDMNPGNPGQPAFQKEKENKYNPLSCLSDDSIAAFTI